MKKKIYLFCSCAICIFYGAVSSTSIVLAKDISSSRVQDTLSQKNSENKHDIVMEKDVLCKSEGFAVQNSQCQSGNDTMNTCVDIGGTFQDNECVF